MTTTVHMVLVNSFSGELDTVEVDVNDTEDCSREVLAALQRENWVLSVGDRIEIREVKNEG